MHHGGLKREVNRFAAACSAKAMRQFAWRQIGQERGEFVPAPVAIARVDVGRAFEVSERSANAAIVPAEIADTPARGEIDEPLSSWTSQIAVLAADDCDALILGFPRQLGRPATRSHQVRSTC